MKFNHNKHNAEQFAYDIKLLGKIIGILHEQVSEHFQQMFPPKHKAQLFEAETIDMAIVKRRAPVLLFKLELSQAKTSS